MTPSTIGKVRHGSAGSRAARVSIVLWLALPALACDQATKAIAKQALAHGDLVALLGGVVRLELVGNTGAFLSLGDALPEPVRHAVFFVLVPIALLALTVSVLRSGPTSTRALWGVSLMLAGGVGNLLDRVFNDGAVVDFVSLGIAGLRTGIFNVADVAILIGIVLFASGAVTPEPEPETDAS